MEPLATLTIGGLIKATAKPFLKAHVLPVFNAMIAGKVKETIFPNGIQQKVHQHLDEAIDVAFPYKYSFAEYTYEEERKAALQNLRAYIFDEDSLELTTVQKQILEEWVKRMLEDPACFQLVEALKCEGRYETMLQMLDSLPDRVSETTEKLLDEKDRIDAARHDETMACLHQLRETAQANAKSEETEKAELIEQIKKKFKDTREAHPSMQLMKISDRLFPEGVATRMSISAVDEWSGKSRSVGAILKDSWRREKNHIMILGEGGIGKTVTLLSIPNWFSKQQGTVQIPAIYIPLYELISTEKDPIADFIKRKIFNRSQAKLDALFAFLDKEWDKKPRLLLLVDGFNEIPADRRQHIGRNIDDWADFSGIQIITSSRFDTSNYFFNRTRYYKVELQPLSEETVVQYLGNVGITYPDNLAVGRLISTPLMLNLFIETSTVIAKRGQNKEMNWISFKDNNTAGAIIWNYLQCEVWNAVTKSENLDRDVNACIVATEFVAPYLARKMYDSGHFSMSESDFDLAMNEVISYFKDLGNHLLPTRIQNCWGKASSSISDIKKELTDLITKQLHILVYWGGRLKFMHQNFRDAMVAIHLINSSYMEDESILPDEWKNLVEFYVMNYIAEIATDKDAGRLWNQNRMTKAGREATINMLELYKRMHNCDFSNLDFGGLDLSGISLCSYLQKNELSLKMPRDAEKLKGTILSPRSFQGVGHASSINAVAITPDDMRCISASDDRSLRIWDMLTGESVCEPLVGHENGVTAIAVTTDGKRCISASNDKTLRIWDLSTGVCESNPLVGHKSSVNAVAITKEGDRCISGSTDGVIHIWDLKTGKSVFGPLKRHQGRVNTLAITVTEKGDRMCISASDDGTLRVWNIDTGRSRGPMRGHTSRVNAVAITERGDKCVSASDDCTIHIWDLNTGKSLFGPLCGHIDRVNAVAITPDGDKCVSVSDDRSFCIWRMEDGACLLGPKTAHDGPVIAVSINQDGSRFVTTSSDRTLRIWKVESGEMVCPSLLGHEGKVTAVAISRDGRRCVSASKDRTVRIWSMITGKCLCVSQTSFEGIVTAVGVTPNRQSIIIASEDRALRIMDLNTKKVVSTPLRGHEDWINAIDITSDSRKCVSASSDKTLRVWDLRRKKCIMDPLEGHKDWVTSVAVVPGNQKCVSASKDKTIRIWDLETGKPIGKPLTGHTNLVRAVDVTNEGGLKCVSASYDGTVRVWNIDHKNPVGKVLGTHKGPVTAIVISPDGRRCISASEDRTLAVWDLENQTLLRVLEAHRGAINALAITKKGDRCISASEDKTLLVWDLKTGKPPITLIGHDSTVTAVSIIPGDRYCVSSSYDSTIRIWDMNDGKCVFKTHILPIDLGGMNISEAELVGGDFLKDILLLNGAVV